jgi:hypothetical protein
MGTVLVEEADPPLSVTKSDEVFAEKPHSHGKTIGIGNFLREQSGNPIAPEQTTHRVPACTRVNSSFSSFETMIPVLPTVFLREFL